MDVVKEGNVPHWQKWETVVKCNGTGPDIDKGCGAELKVKFKDLVMMHWYGTHFRHSFAAVKCPLCFKYTSAKVPDGIWKNFDTQKNQKKSVFTGTDDRI